MFLSKPTFKLLNLADVDQIDGLSKQKSPLILFVYHFVKMRGYLNQDHLKPPLNVGIPHIKLGSYINNK